MTRIVNAAPKTIHPGTAAGGTDHRYGRRVKTRAVINVSTRKKRKQFENLIVGDGVTRDQARKASREGYISRTLTPEEEAKWITPADRKAVQDHMKKEGITPAF